MWQLFWGQAKLQRIPCDRWGVGWSEMALGTGRYIYWNLHSRKEFPEPRIFTFSDVIKSYVLSLGFLRFLM